MADERISFNLEADDDALQKAMKDFVASVEKAESKTIDLKDSGDQAFKELAESIMVSEEELLNLLKTSIDYNMKLKKQQSLTEQLKKGVSDTVREYRVFGVSLGSIVDFLNKKQTALKGAQKGLSATAKGFKILRAAIISTGIGALVVALGSLVAFLSRTEKGMDVVNQVLAALNATVAAAVKRLANLGKAIGDFLTGNIKFKDLVKESGEAISSLSTEMREAAAAAVLLTRRQQQLRDQQRAFIVDAAILARRIKEQLEIVEDETKSYNDRIDAQKEAIKFQDVLNEKNRKNLKDRLDNLKEEERIEGILFDKREELAQAQADLFNFDTESNAQRRSDEMALNDLIQEQSDKVKKLKDEYEKFIDTIKDDTRLAEIELITDPIEKLVAQRDFALEELEEKLEDAKEKALESGLKLPEDIDEQIADLLDSVRDKFNLEIEKANREGFKNFDFLSKQFEESPGLGITAGAELIVDSITADGFEERLEKETEEFVDVYAEKMEKAFKDKRSVFEKIKDFFIGLFGVTEEELAFIADSTLLIGQNLIASLESFNQAAITAQENIIRTLDNQISETQGKLDEEIRRREAGFANDAELLEQSLEEQQAAREEAEKKRLELEKKAANQRLAINAAEQASNYVLAATKLVSAEASKGIIGLFAALAGLSILLKVIATSKAQSEQFKDIPKFREGDPYIDGPGSGTSDSIFARISKGERIVSAKQNQQLGGRGLSNEELVENNAIARVIKDMMSGTTSGNTYEDQYKIAAPIVELTTQVIQKERESERLKIQNQFNVMKGAYERAADKAADKMIKYWKSRPFDGVDKDGIPFKQWWEGDAIKRQRFLPPAKDPENMPSDLSEDADN